MGLVQVCARMLPSWSKEVWRVSSSLTSKGADIIESCFILPYVILKSKDILKSFCLPQVSVATGCAARDRNIVFASGLATFFSRAYDQLRMAAISESNINLCGSHCGLSAGKESFFWFYKRQKRDSHIRQLRLGYAFRHKLRKCLNQTLQIYPCNLWPVVWSRVTYCRYNIHILNITMFKIILNA